MGERDSEPAPGMLAKIECACAQCAARCRFAPGWYAPDEARRAINAGLAGRMMLDYWIDDPVILVLCPAVRGREGDLAPSSEDMGGFAALFSSQPKGVCVPTGARYTRPSRSSAATPSAASPAEAHRTGT